MTRIFDKSLLPLAGSGLGPALALGLLLFPGAASAADADGKFEVFGSGNLSCERWTIDRREGNPSAAQSEMWVAGYLTAYNQYVFKDQDITDRYSEDYVLEWLDDYCRKRPPNALVVAVRDLVHVLRRRR